MRMENQLGWDATPLREISASHPTLTNLILVPKDCGRGVAGLFACLDVAIRRLVPSKAEGSATALHKLKK